MVSKNIALKASIGSAIVIGLVTHFGMGYIDISPGIIAGVTTFVIGYWGMVYGGKK